MTRTSPVSRSRMLLLGDFHGRHAAVERVAECLDEHGIDTIVLCGDFTNFGEHFEALFRFIKKHGLTCAFVSGNHESKTLCQKLSSQYGFSYLDYRQEVVRGLLLTGIGGYDMYSAERTFNVHEFASKDLRSGDAPVSVLLTHEPPYPWSYKGKDEGSQTISEFVEGGTFDLIVTGHFHEPDLRIEKRPNGVPVINPGDFGCILDVDFGARCLTVMNRTGGVSFMHGWAEGASRSP